MSHKDIAQTIDANEAMTEAAENERRAMIAASIMNCMKGETIYSSIDIVTTVLEHMLRQFPPLQQNDMRQNVVAMLDPESYNRQEVSDLNSREDDNTSSSGDTDGSHSPKQE